jgi:YD repeat-containing protein
MKLLFKKNKRVVTMNKIDSASHRVTNADGNMLNYDENGNMTSGVDTTLVYNWDNKLRSAAKGGTTINLKYDPAGNRTYKETIGGTSQGKRKYIVDVVGGLPTILLELDPDDAMDIERTYIYGNSQILAQHDGNIRDKRLR